MAGFTAKQAERYASIFVTIETEECLPHPSIVFVNIKYRIQQFSERNKKVGTTPCGLSLAFKISGIMEWTMDKTLMEYLRFQLRFHHSNICIDKIVRKA